MKKFLEIYNGVKIPMVGFGTWKIEGVESINIISTAINLGYRHIDTSLNYGNLENVKESIKFSKIDRNELFIVAKLESYYHDNPEICLQKTLEALGTDYLDLFLVHWPVTFENINGKPIYKNGRPLLKPFDPLQIWKKMEKFVLDSRVKSIGVCNFGIKNLKKILEFCEIKPSVLQIECHPYLQQKELRDFCRKNDIKIIAFSPLGSHTEGLPKLRDDPVINEIAQKNNCTSSQVLLSWLIYHEIAVLPRSSKKEHIEQNFNIVELSKEDYDKIDNINKNIRYLDHPDFGPGRYE